ncbi:MAG: cofactor-independent phosphoglycerate mutase, partial [Oscillospiraceae bacterium]|nr:cofactor-independent phosphoglycerate mutase [Oscillospiraceae bacterium]
MKYAVILFDGMADYPVPALGGKTPMETAYKPCTDGMAAKGFCGLVKTVPDALPPGSDVANLSAMGYNPLDCYTGRSPLEAVSIGIKLNDTDVTLRSNLVTLSDGGDFEGKTMDDYCAGDISTEEAAEIMETVAEHFNNDKYNFYSGVSYRHCLVWDKGNAEGLDLTPPHDISGRKIGGYLSKSPAAAPLVNMMKESYALLKDHPVNLERMRRGLRPANSIWLWGEGTKPRLAPFEELYGLKGSVISAVDLLKGIGILAGMSAPRVEGATGYIDTNFTGKADAALKEFENGRDFVFVHLEAPDECGHRNEPENKVKSIEMIDELVVKKIKKGLGSIGDYKIMVLPDHPTPIATRTHARDPVPFMIYDSTAEI